MPPLPEGEEPSEWDVLANQPDAWIILYLCSVDWRQYRANATKMIDEIEAWADANISGREEQYDAVVLAFRMRSDSKKNIATARLNGGSGGK